MDAFYLSFWGCPSFPQTGVWLVLKGHVCRMSEPILPKSIGGTLWFHAAEGSKGTQKARLSCSGKAQAGDNFAQNPEHFSRKANIPNSPKTADNFTENRKVWGQSTKHFTETPHIHARILEHFTENPEHFTEIS
jgi:hypothetical protein